MSSHKEMINITIWLNICIPGNVTINFGYKRLQSSYVVSPQFWRYIIRSPRLNLFSGIVA